MNPGRSEFHEKPITGINWNDLFPPIGEFLELAIESCVTGLSDDATVVN